MRQWLVRAGAAVMALAWAPAEAAAQPPAQPARAAAADSAARLVAQADSAVRLRTPEGAAGAIRLLRAAAALYGRAEQRARVGFALSRMGSAFRIAGQPDSALAYFRQALRVRREAGDLAGASATLNNIGLVHADAGRLDSAVADYGRALRIARAAGDAAGQGYALGNLGVAYISLGRPDSALAHYRAALPIWRRLGNREGEAGALVNMGEISAGAGRRGDALTAYRQALAIWRELGDRGGEGLTMNNIGALYQDLGRADSALAYYRRALLVWRAVDDPASASATLHNVAEAWHELGRPDSALAYYGEALAAQRALGERDGEAETLSSLAALYAHARPNDPTDPARAAAYFDSATAVYGGLWAQAGGDANAVSVAEQQQTVFAAWALAWLARGAELGPRASVAGALAAAERGRARAFLGLLRQGDGSTERQADSTAAPRVGADLVAEADALLAPLRRRGTPALSYLLTRDTLVTWLVAADGVLRVHEAAVSRDTVAALVRALHAELAGARPGTGRAAERLTSLLLPPSLRPYLPRDGDLAVIPSGPIAAVPFAALTPEPAGPPLGLRYALRYAPSLAALAAADSAGLPGAAVGSLNEALVVGNPAAPAPPSVQRGDDRAMEWGPLPGAAREARWVATRLGARALTGRTATESTVRARLEAAPVVHLATHGYAFGAAARARDSFVVLAPDAASDGLLTAGELLDAPGPRLRATLVVLSACRTGLGALTQSEGVVGLQRAFLARGARSVVASLWNVSDAATELLMQRLYSHWLSDPDRPGKAESLRRAQADVRQVPRFAQPRYWAAFQLVGAA